MGKISVLHSDIDLVINMIYGSNLGVNMNTDNDTAMLMTLL